MIENNSMEGKVTTIALTGGPCAGKSTCLSKLEQELTEKGYKVFVVEEMATNVIKSGVSPLVVGLRDFQKMLMQLQVYRNKVYTDIANSLAVKTGKHVVIIYDRGIPDCKGFITDELYDELIKELGLDEINVLDYYDAVFHLVTAADGAEEFYTCENNTARTETPEEAIERDKACMQAWIGHPHLRVITNKNCTFEQKVDRLLNEVYALLGIPVPVEIERKFLIEKPNLKELSKRFSCTTVEIVQTYLNEIEDGVERRIRQRGINGDYTFYYTEKKKISSLSRTEKERKISQDEYIRLLTEADTSLHQIKKKRTSFVCDGTYYELDTYPFSDDRAILEIEFTSETESKHAKIPEGIKLLSDITEDSRFKNRSLAETLSIPNISIRDIVITD